MLYTISLAVRGQQLKSESVKMASNTVNEVECLFDFDEVWNVDVKRAVFSNDRGNRYSVVIINDRCFVPHEVLTGKGAIYVNVVGAVMNGEDLTERITTYKTVIIENTQKVYTDGMNTVAPTPSEFEQFVERVAEHEAEQNFVRDDEYVHTDNNYTNAEKEKLEGIEDGAEKNLPNTVVDDDYVHTDNNFSDTDKQKLSQAITDAPEDGKQYARKDGEWAEVQGGGGGGSVDSVNGKTGVVVLDAEDIGALPDDTEIPTKTSDLTNDSGYQNASDVAAAVLVEQNARIADTANKVDKVAGKGLSSNDFTDTEKTKLQGLTNYDDTEVRSLIGGKQDIISDLASIRTNAGKGATAIQATDYAGASTAGVVKTPSTYGVGTNSSGNLYGLIIPAIQYASSSSNAIISKGTLDNSFYNKSEIDAKIGNVETLLEAML